jgi:hypothetical protein
VAEELLQNLNGCVAEVSIAKRNEQVVLQAGENGKPLVKLFILELLLQACFEDFDVGPFQVH